MVLAFFFRAHLFFIFGCTGSLLLSGLSLVADSGCFSLGDVPGLLSAVASLVGEHRLWGSQLWRPGLVALWQVESF